MAVVVSFSKNISRLALVVVVVGILLTSKQGVMGQCEGDFQGLATQCSKFVVKEGPKIPPSKECCDLIQKVNVPCICKHVTKEMEQAVSMEKMIYVAEFCGKSVPHGTKCGSFTIPQIA